MDAGGFVNVGQARRRAAENGRALIDASREELDARGKGEGAAALQHYSGIAPVTKQSGGKRHVHRRYLCPKFLRQSFHEYAKESILHSRWAAASHQQQREKGSPHHTAVRALAFKWQRIIFRLWQDKTVYREEIHEAALRKTGRALVARFDHIEVGKSPFKKPHQENLNYPLSDPLRGELSDGLGGAGGAHRALTTSRDARTDAGEAVRCSAWLN